MTVIGAPSGDWQGTREPQAGYKLDSQEDLSGPKDEGFEFLLVKLGSTEKEVIKKFTTYLVQHWPSKRLTSDLAENRNLALVDACGFWHALFSLEFKKFLDLLAAAPEGNRSPRVSPPIVWR